MKNGIGLPYDLVVVSVSRSWVLPMGLGRSRGDS
jgi:hypothetical protein